MRRWGKRFFEGPLEPTGQPAWMPEKPAAPKDKQPQKIIFRLLWQSGAAATLLLIAWGIFKIDAPWAEPLQQQVRALATEDMAVLPLQQAVARLGLWTDVTQVAPALAPALAPVLGTEAVPALSPTARDSYGSMVEVPIRGMIVQSFGLHGGEYFPSIRIAAPVGSQVTADRDGQVARSWEEGGGTYLQINRGNGDQLLIGPLDAVTVQPGQSVTVNTPLGRLARSNDGRQGQLSLELRRDGRNVAPLPAEEATGSTAATGATGSAGVNDATPKNEGEPSQVMAPGSTSAPDSTPALIPAPAPASPPTSASAPGTAQTPASAPAKGTDGGEAGKSNGAVYDGGITKSKGSGEGTT